MRLSQLTEADVLLFLHLDGTEGDISPSALLAAARGYIRSETGLDDEEMDEHEDLSAAALVLCADMYENRLMTSEMKYGGSSNRTVEAILGFHRKNLV